MPLYLDIHRDVDGLTPDAVEGAHARDLEVQDKHGVEIMKYWYNLDQGFISCLVRAPNAEAARQVHAEAHGLVADEVIEVTEGE